MPRLRDLISAVVVLHLLGVLVGYAEPVEASLLVASPGSKVFQSMGHAAIRLQCPAYGLDNVFSYETDYRGGLAGQILGQAYGRYARITYDDYCRTFTDEGRSVTSYRLNLTDSEIRQLWMLCDDAAESGIESNFNLRLRNCNSAAFDKITEALSDEMIVMHDDSLSRMDNGRIIRTVLSPDRPWSVLALTAALGNNCNLTDSWRTRMMPVVMSEMLPTATIRSTDGTERPLIAGAPAELFAASARTESPIATPDRVFGLILGLSVIISAAGLSHRWARLVMVADRVALGLQTAASLILIAIAVLPLSIGGAWNWLYIPLNPLPAIVWLTGRRKTGTKVFFIVYGAACALFVAAPVFTSNAGTWSSLLSAAISLRVLSHYLPTVYHKAK